MYKVIPILLLLILQLAYAQEQDKNIHQTTISITPQIGYSVAKSSFNISGNELGKNPNVLSELIWDPTNSLEYGLDIGINHKKIFFQASLLLNSTILGNVSDIDYDGDNRTLAYSELYLSNHKGSGYSISFQPGYYWIRTSKTSLGTYASVNLNSKKLYLLNNDDWSSSDRAYIEGLNSYYKYTFPNYGIGIRLNQKIVHNLHAEIALEGYLNKYKAYGNWNLIEEFEKPVSYEHFGNGRRIITDLCLKYQIATDINIGLNYHYSNFAVSGGKDYLYTLNQGILKTRLNEASEYKHSFLLNLEYKIPFIKYN